jgi:hypothetical protein
MTFTRGVVFVGIALLGACANRHEVGLAGFAQLPRFGERTRVMTLDSGVTATIVAPERLDARKRVDLILYALPNGNTTAQTMGRTLTQGMDWHFDIQHIAAQTRALRTMGMPQAVVVYLEANTKSWPEWRRARGYEQANARIVAMVDRLRGEFASAPDAVVTLTGHSGGGSFMFGFIEASAALPSWMDRIAFLDANYNFNPKHGDKLAAWLRSDARSTLVSVAYDDREIMLDGKKVVSDSGGTWRATERMLTYFTAPFALQSDSLGDFRRYHSAQMELLRHPNPANRILHTEMIGEMNGYMHAMLVRRPGNGPSVLKPQRAYTPWVEPD